jgi:choline-sulfatase
LRPCFKGRGLEEHDAVFAEALCEGAIAPLVMIRRDHYKYVHSEPDPPQLFDLAADPDELENIADQPAYQKICRRFKNEVTANWDLKNLHQQVLASQRRRKLVYRALRQGKYASWDFQPHQDATQKYMRNHLDLNVLERRARFPSQDVPEPDGKDA